jgi:hypothetical protein
MASEEERVASWLDGRLAARVLAVIGALLGSLGLIAAVVGAAAFVQTRGASCEGWITACMGQGLLPLGLAIGAIGGTHLLVATGVRSRRTWGRWLGLLVALAGLLGSLLAAVPDLADGGIPWPYAVPVIAYGVSLMGLWRWYPH